MNTLIQLLIGFMNKHYLVYGHIRKFESFEPAYGQISPWHITQHNGVPIAEIWYTHKLALIFGRYSSRSSIIELELADPKAGLEQFAKRILELIDS